MGDGLETAVDRLESYGPAALALALVLGGLGVPVPATMLLLAAGAFARQGRFEPAVAFGLAVLGAVGGDSGSYLLGRYGLRRFLGRLEQGVSWRRAETTFERRGGIAIVLTRFLLTPLALPTNLIAGSEKYPLRYFVALCAVGELIWVLLYGGLGYVFADRWAAIGGLVGDISGWLVAALVVGVALYEIYIHWRGHLTKHPDAAPAPAGI